VLSYLRPACFQKHFLKILFLSILPIQSMLLELFLAPFRGLAVTGAAAYVPLPTQLGNLAFSQINFTENCSTIPLGISVFQNDFFKAKVYPPAELTNGTGYWPDGYLDVWRDGKPSAEWIAFWRAIVDSNLPKNYEPFSDDQIAAWVDSTDFLEFFSWIWNADYITDPNKLAYYISIGGGCNNYQFPPIQYLFSYIAEYGFPQPNQGSTQLTRLQDASFFTVAHAKS
jgi:hypothetical protein